MFAVLLYKICLTRRKSSVFCLKKQRQFLTKFLNNFKITMFQFLRFLIFYARFSCSVLFSVNQSDYTNESDDTNQSDATSDPNVSFPNKSEDLKSYTLPGLYRISCLVTNKVYIGESNNVLLRITSHARKLASKTHDCPLLQTDYNQHGLNNFTFHVLFSGPDWADVQTRKDKEKEILSSYSPDQVYNVHPDAPTILTPNYRVVCRINGKTYNSILEAVEDLKVPETVLRNKLNNKVEGYEIIDKPLHGYTPVIIDGDEFDSLVAVVEAGLAKNREQVGRRLRSDLKKWEGWQYKYGKKKVLQLRM